MKLKRLGNAQTYVSAVGQGMATPTDFCPDADFANRRISALKLGLELGMTFIDTAEVYANGYSEELVGRAILGMRDKVFVATKVLPEHLSYADVIRCAEESLKRLKTDYLDLYQVHWPNPNLPLGRTFLAMEKLASQGKIRYIGVCNFTLKELKEAINCLSKGSLVSVQAEYNLLDRSIEDSLLNYCRQNGVTVIAYSPLIQGRIAVGSERMRRLNLMAQRYNRSCAQIALNWLVRHPAVIAIPKAENFSHIRENASSCDFDLTDDDFRELNNIFKLQILRVPIDRIRVSDDVAVNRKIYKTVEEAKENKFGFVPSPMQLARDILDQGMLKPVRVIKSSEENGRYDYDLAEGRIRYWAWVIAYDGKVPVPVYVNS